MQRFKLYLIRYCAWIRYGEELQPTFALCGDTTPRNNDDVGQLWDVQDIIEKSRFVWGVPKIRTCQGLLNLLSLLFTQSLFSSRNFLIEARK